MSITAMFEMDSLRSQGEYMTTWASDMKSFVDKALLHYLKQDKAKDMISFKAPGTVLMIPTVAIGDTGMPHLSSFREVMHHSNMMSSISRTGQYEAAGTVWMLDPVDNSSSDVLTISQLDNAMRMWSPEAYAMSCNQASGQRWALRPLTRHCCRKISQPLARPLMAKSLPMIAGRALVITWYSAMGDAGCACAPIRTVVVWPASLKFSETMFATHAASGADSFWKFAERATTLMTQNAPNTRLRAVMKGGYGWTFKVKTLMAFVGDESIQSGGGHVPRGP